jgi:uncharacterized protein (DUF58 family)
MTAPATTLRSRLAGWRLALEQQAERRLPALTRHRRAEALPIALHRRRIYVLPTRFGLMFAVMLCVMLLGALNFNNNAALLLTFLLGGSALISLPRTVRNLEGVRLIAVDAEPVHAGDDAHVELRLRAGDDSVHPQLLVRQGERQRAIDLDEGGAAVRLPVPTSRRGWQAVGRITISTDFPFGLFYAWSVLHPDERVLVLPTPEREAPALPRGGGAGQTHAVDPNGEDWQGLRDYRGGDAPRLVAWRASARADRLLVKELADPRADEVILDYERVGALPHEARIARLTRWVLDASAQNLPFALHLPGVHLRAGRGAIHRAQALRELALLP